MNERERDVLRSTIEALLLTLWIGVPVEVWSAFWTLHVDDGEAVRTAFLHIYGLEIATIIPEGEEVPIDVVRPLDVGLYVEWSVFLLTPAAACLSGCQQSVVSHP